MAEKQSHMIPIWFFIGINVLVYGVVIFATGLVHLHDTTATVQMAEKHPAIWWGGMMIVVGLFYTIRFRPSAHSGLDEPPTDHIAEKGTKWT